MKNIYENKELKEKINGKLDVASFQSLLKKDNLEELVKDYGSLKEYKIAGYEIIE